MFNSEITSPGGIVRSGIIEPIGVRSVSPVTRAREAINPFIEAIRPTGSHVVPGFTMVSGALGARTIAPVSLVGDDGLGIVTVQDMPLADFGQIDRKSYLYGVGGLVLGLISGYLLSRAVR